MISRACLTFTFVLIQSVLSHYGKFGPAVYQLTEPVEHGEGPTWDSRTGLLYFVDISMGKIFSYDPINGESYFVKLDGTVSPLVQCKSDAHRFVVGVNRSVVLVKWDGKHEISDRKILTTVAEEFPTSRFNDGKADKLGRLWFGTMGFENSSGVVPFEGALYYITKGNIGNPKAIIKPVTVSNGLAWNKANNKFYYIDTPTYEIAEYDFHERTGEIFNRRVVLNIKDALGTPARPDGMTIDVDDNLWVALHGSSSVVKIDPIQGKILLKIAIPAQHVTSVMWGGDKLDVLFVTTSRVQLNALQRQQLPAAGSLFAVTGLGTHGLPVFEADINDLC